jgi:alkylation response protein AidB-like acyl-CoA dehydrogenase
VSTIHHYKSNLRDIEFNLFEVLRIQDVSLGKAPFGSMDEATARDVLAQFEKMASTTMAESFADADRQGLRFDREGNVSLPESLKRSLAAFREQGWDKLELPERLGGYGAPPSIIWSAFEMLAGAHASAAFYNFGTFIARIIDRLGTPTQKARYVEPMIASGWGGSMVLTEPDAGSDVGAARAKARHVAGDVWEIEGVKRFITNGDFDGPENIVHLVLARPEGAGPGTKGLSMFIVPKFWVNEDGSLGERNGVFATNVEKKMGIKASATCEMTFGADKPARGLLVGEVHDGIRQMFHVIEHARMAVGVKAMSTLSTGYLNALAYAKDRVQGPDLLRMMDKAAPRVTIIHHPDVRRMLLAQKAHAEGLRALACYTASLQDRIELGGGHGAQASDGLDRLNDLLLPLVKGYGSEKAYELLALSLQCYGGSGYCQDYPIEQYIRDAKIDTLYEGTTHIQALDLFFRKVAKDGGETLRAFLGELGGAVAEGKAMDAIAADAQAVERAFGELQGIFGAIMGKLGESPYHVGLQANRILVAVAETIIGALLLRQGVVAARALEGAGPATGTERAFYVGKLASLRYFTENVLPGLTLTRKLVEKSSLTLLELDEAAF